MTEHEIADLLNGTNSNIIAAQAVFLTILSAYLVVAYSVGRSLAAYQVGFINFAFILMMFVGFNTQLAQLAVAYAYADELAILRDSMERIRTEDQAVRIVFSDMRLVLVIGALMFMWQVRHPKKERPIEFAPIFETVTKSV